MDAIATALARAASDEDPRVGLAAVASLRVLLDSLEEFQVASARAKGWSWQDIADVLGVSRQAVHKKHGRRIRGRPGPPAARPGAPGR